MQKDVNLEPNANEVKRCWYVSEIELKELLQKAAEDSNILVTPWFKMITDHFLYKWWASLRDLSQFENDSEIHKMPGVPAPVLQLWQMLRTKKAFLIHHSIQWDVWKFLGVPHCCFNVFLASQVEVAIDL